MGEPVPPQLTHEAPDLGEHGIGHIARVDPVERLAVDRFIGEDVTVRLGRRDGPQAGRPHPDRPRGEGDERFVLDGAPQRQERLLVAEVAGQETAVEAEQQVGAALVGAERLDEQLGAVRFDTEVRRRPASVDSRAIELAQGDPDGGEPVDDGLQARPA